jgi:tetratricopeptide (TPR) repeat protein
MQYAYLQLGQDGKAKALMDEAGAVTKIFRPILGSETGLAAVPARYMLERQDWRGAAQLQVPAMVTAPPAQAITHFARAVGAARSGDVGAAKADIGKLQEFKAALDRTGQTYWAGQVHIQILAAQAWAAQAEGNRTEALRLMHAAADQEDRSEKHVAMENRLYPMRELLADLLLEQGQAAAALSEYEASLKQAPERLRGFYGAAKAAEAAGDKAASAHHLRSLADLTRTADSDRPEIRAATAAGK